jgi:tetraacyldisaccharide 4'-kinase
MKAPAFWTAERSLAADALAPFSAAWSLLARRTLTRRSHHAPAPALYIGNFTVGGAGKTPLADHVAARLSAFARRPAILSRGYGGSLSGRDPVLVDPARHGAREVGDEPILLARRWTVVVGADRRRSAALAVREGADALILDDGFQSRAFSAPAVVVADARTGVGNGRVLPAGPLRAPLRSQWPLVSALLILGEGARAEPLATEAMRRGVPVFWGGLAASEPFDQTLRGRRVFAFAGIGRPEKFFDTLESVGAAVIGRAAFPDHHPYSHRELSALRAEARRLGADLIVTTEKDEARLPQRPHDDLPVIALPVRLRLDEPDRFDLWLRSVLAGPSRELPTG